MTDSDKSTTPSARAKKTVTEEATSPWSYGQATSFLRIAKDFVKAQRHMDLEAMRKVRDRIEEDMNLAMGRRS